MKNNRTLILLITAGAFLFNSIFWSEQLGINTVIFDVFILASIYFLYPAATKRIVARVLLLVHLVCLFALVAYHSMAATTAFLLTLLLLVAFAEYTHRSAWFAGGSLLLSFTQFPGGFARLLKGKQPAANRPGHTARFIRFAIFPLLIVICFIILYSAANTVFAGIANSIGAWTGRLFNGFFKLFSFERLLFLVLGLYCTGALLLRSRSAGFENRDAGKTDNLPRVRKKRMDMHRSLAYDLTVGIMGKLAKGPLALKNEYRTGCISLALLNVLLLVVNSIDIDYLWLHFTYTPAVDLFTMIHEGTELLIFSIVLAMLVLLIFFRGNLNFYKQNKWLKWGAYCWLLQNTVLVFSVLLRDYYYIREFGLAYKRIGVIFFLLLVLAGLVTVFLKVRFAKTNYFLLRMNAWCVVALLAAGAMVQWDVWIAEYNIAHRQSAPLNLPYLLTLSDKVLPVMYKHLPELKEREKELNATGIYMGRGNASLESVLAMRRDDYLQEQQQYSWLSWNYTDAGIKAYFRSNTPPQVAARR